MQVCVQAEQLCWGDAALYLRMPTPALGGSAVAAAGTPGAEAALPGRLPRRRTSDLGRDGDHRAGRRLGRGRDPDHRAPGRRRVGAERHQDLLHRGEGASQVEGGFVVVWATLDKQRGPRRDQVLRGARRHAGHEAGRAREEARDPRLRHGHARLRGLPHPHARTCSGRAEVKKQDERPAGDKGFKGAMATFDASRPIVAAMAVGVGRASLEFLIEELARQGVAIRYDTPRARCSAIERDVIEMEAELQAARLLTWRAAWMMDHGTPQQPRGLDGEGQGRARRSRASRRRRSSCSARSATRRSCWSRSGCATPRSTTSTRARSRSTS